VLRDKPVLSASPTRFDGVRAADHLRGVLDRIGATVAPIGLSVAVAHERLGEHTGDPTLVAELAVVLAHAMDQAPETAGAGLAPAAS
jgi:NAD(P)H-dependent FMN reductase